jgi:hypothetical protein
MSIWHHDLLCLLHSGRGSRAVIDPVFVRDQCPGWSSQSSCTSIAVMVAILCAPNCIDASIKCVCGNNTNWTGMYLRARAPQGVRAHCIGGSGA